MGPGSHSLRLLKTFIKSRAWGEAGKEPVGVGKCREGRNAW